MDYREQILCFLPIHINGLSSRRNNDDVSIQPTERLSSMLDQH